MNHHRQGTTPHDRDHPDPDDKVYVISMAAELTGMHAQTLRTYDRLGIVSPLRTRGGGRRYSLRDIALLREVQRLSTEEGINLAGIKHILELTTENERLRRELSRYRNRPSTDLVPVPRSTAIVVWEPR